MKIRLKAPKPLSYEAEPQSLGGHLKKRRHELGLLQKEIAARMGVNEWTYHKWENDKAEPVVGMFPRILEFLGYEPWPCPRTMAEQLLATRRKMGVSQERMANILGLDEGTVARAENGQDENAGETKLRIQRYFHGSSGISHSNNRDSGQTK